MASRDRLKEIQQTRIPTSTDRETHFSRIPKPANMRAMLWVAGAVVLASSLIGALQSSSRQATLSYDQASVNDQLHARTSKGSGSVRIERASVLLESGLFQMDAVASDGVYRTALGLTGSLKFDPLNHMILIENPETEAGEVAKIGRETGDDVADYVPQDWTFIQAVVRKATNVATGETFSAMQFKNKAKRALWGMNVFEIPAKDRKELHAATVDSVTVQGGSIVLSASGREMTPLTAISLIFMVGSAALLLVLRAYPDLARG